eukprot:m.149207 g.149207  ORF g.149207 m.149207 type:complete len:89 (-) comp14202_c1_seq7:299-565(-)
MIDAEKRCTKFLDGPASIHGLSMHIGQLQDTLHEIGHGWWAVCDLLFLLLAHGGCGFATSLSINFLLKKWRRCHSLSVSQQLLTDQQS